MPHHVQRDNATSNVLAWSAHSANVEFAADEEGAGEADEPPERQAAGQFRRTSVVRRLNDQHESLLTKALQSHSEDDHADEHSGFSDMRRRRSMTSNISLASTAEWTTDTGITTPARTSSPSPHLPQAGFAPFAGQNGAHKELSSSQQQRPSELATAAEPRRDPAVEALQRKRCISFACAARPTNPASTAAASQLPRPSVPAETPAPAQQKRPTIKFACPAKPHASTTSRQLETASQRPVAAPQQGASKDGLPAAVRRYRRSLTPRRASGIPVALRSKKYITADSDELEGGLCRFHEFASDEHQEDDWITQETTAARGKLTIHDTLEKENAIRRLGTEAEEEANLEDEDAEVEDDDAPEDDDDLDDEDASDLEDEEAALEEDEDDRSGYGEDDDVSDGYNTDNEIGFADSDEDEDDDLVLWTTKGVSRLDMSDATPVVHPSSYGGDHSDSSTYSTGRQARVSKSRHRAVAERLALRVGTPELPDSTDFVCGTLDEDRPLEEAYVTHMAARKREKLHLIPQDIDPSFPTSEPEDDEGEGLRGAHESDDHVWLHGELELEERMDRRKKKGDRYSPKRYRSPPPKRHHSPPPRARGRSPRRLFDLQSPRRITRSPAPQPAAPSPAASLVHLADQARLKALAARPGLTHTKSLPRAPGMLAHIKSGRRGKAAFSNKDRHIRGAIDIVKGLEQKRQRRKEKFYQKYCSRARKGQVQEKKPQPGQGAERMRELGLLMAGKIMPGNYVLSV